MKTRILGLLSIFILTVTGLGLGTSASAAKKPMAPTANTASGSDQLSMLPDGMGVIEIDFAQITASSFWSTLTAPGKTPKVVESALGHLNDLGLKLSDLQSAAIEFSGVSTNNMVLLVTGTFNQDDLLSRLRAKSEIKVTTSTYKNTNIYTVTGSSAQAKRTDVSFAFLNGGSAVLGSDSGIKSALDVQDGSKPSMASNSVMESAIAEAGPGAVRFAVIPPEGLFSSAQSSKMPLPDFSSIKLIFGTLAVSSSLDLSATLRNDTPEHASAIADQINGLLTMVKGILGSPTDPKKASIAAALKTVQVNTSGTDVKVTGSLSNELLSQLIH